MGGLLHFEFFSLHFVDYFVVDSILMPSMHHGRLRRGASPRNADDWIGLTKRRLSWCGIKMYSSVFCVAEFFLIPGHARCHFVVSKSCQ